jgi:hypothetical protein
MRLRSFALAALAALLVAAHPHGQSGAARPALPRTPDGKPDLAGVWQAMNAASWNIQDHAGSEGVPAGQGIVEGDEIPYQPSALAKKQDNFKNRATEDPEAKCYLPGTPRIMYMPYPFQIVQTPTHIAMLFEYVHATRNIFMNTPHWPGAFETFMGDSRGKWEGDTLVVDVADLTDGWWFDRAGNFASDMLHLVERYTMVSPDHIQYDVTVEDPKVFMRPWKMSMTLYRHKEPNARVLEYECYIYQREKAALAASGSPK